jgi:NTP pyrophosphatase (non-canonical NTP hydrolase)
MWRVVKNADGIFYAVKDNTVEEKTELEEYQEWVEQTTSHVVPKGLRGWWAATILSCEAAEVLELHEKSLRKEGSCMVEDKNKVMDELGDTFWSLAAVANAYGLTLDEIIEHNIQKINERVYGAERSGSDKS